MSYYTFKMSKALLCCIRTRTDRTVLKYYVHWRHTILRFIYQSVFIVGRLCLMGKKKINPICVDHFTERWRAHVVYVQFFRSEQTLKRFWTHGHKTFPFFVVVILFFPFDYPITLVRYFFVCFSVLFFFSVAVSLRADNTNHKVKMYNR